MSDTIEADGGQLELGFDAPARDEEVQERTVSLPASPFGIIQQTAFPPRRGTSELIAIYNDSPWLRAVVHKVGQGVAETAWRLFVSRDSEGRAVRNKQAQRAPRQRRRRMLAAAGRYYRERRLDVDINEVTELTDHPLLDLLMLGNEELLGFNALMTTQVHLDLVGEAFWIKERNNLGVPIAYWPIPPDWVLDLPTRDDPHFRVSARSGGLVNLDVPVTEMLYFRDPNPSNPYGRGSGTARALGDELEVDEFAAKHLKSFFFNRARPDVIVSGDNISKEDAKRLEQQWKQKHEGFFNAFKPLFFSRQIDVKTLSQTFENMQMVELRKHERDAFINVYGIPPEKLGVVGESKRSTIAAADFFWTKDIIAPRVELLRNFIQWKLVPEFDARLILDYDTPIVQDEQFELESMRAAPWAYTVNEWREQANRPAVENGERHVFPVNTVLVDVAEGENTPADSDNEPGVPEADPADEGDGSDPATSPDEQEEESMKLLAEKVAGSLTPALRQAIARRVEGRKKAARS